MKTNADNAHKAAQNLYTASRELALPAAQHELMGTSHDLLHNFIREAEQTRERLARYERAAEADPRLKPAEEADQ